jgi:DNA-directed RNA polymerase specialized sigma24 family protein
MPSERGNRRETIRMFDSLSSNPAIQHETDETMEELAMIPPRPLSTPWTDERHRHLALNPTCNLLRGFLSLDVYTQAVVYLFLIKGWSSRRTAESLDVSLIMIQELLISGREKLKRRLTESQAESGLANLSR